MASVEHPKVSAIWPGSTGLDITKTHFGIDAADVRLALGLAGLERRRAT